MTSDPAGWRTLVRGLAHIPLAITPTCVITSGGFRLMQLFGGLPVLNLDIGVLARDEIVREAREHILAAADKFGIDILPVSVTALHRARDQYSGFNGQGYWKPPSPELVSRTGYEAVFTLGDDFYLTGYDDQESPPLYFLCQLPREVGSVREAREALMPESVRAAKEAGVAVARQGDLFMVKSSLSKRALLKMGASLYSGVPIYGTAHTAANIAVLPNGLTLIKGKMQHRPSLLNQDRNPDHRPRRPGRGWWWVARNTVPVQPQGRQPRHRELLFASRRL